MPRCPRGRAPPRRAPATRGSTAGSAEPRRPAGAGPRSRTRRPSSRPDLGQPRLVLLPGDGPRLRLLAQLLGGARPVRVGAAVGEVVLVEAVLHGPDVHELEAH